MRTKKTKNEALQEIINDYMTEFPESNPTMRTIAAWAIRRGDWVQGRGSPERQCAKELAAAAREEIVEDPQGRRVRRKHVARIDGQDGHPLFVWANIEDATPEHMRLSLSQRRQAQLGDVLQHKTDTDSYNDNNQYGARLNFSYNYNEDLAELQQPTEYPDSPPDED